jgi:3-oxoacyl-[acyl-carrier-protein] synthase-3
MTSIQAIVTELPEREVTNEQLDREHPEWRMDLVAELTGIRSRRVAAEDETALDLSLKACEALLSQPEIDADGIDAILCCTQTTDYRGLANAFLLHERLGFGDGVLAFDIRLACSGFVYGLAVADALACRGAASRILLVTAETPSKFINSGDRSARTLFGDGAAVCYLTPDDRASGGGRIVASRLQTHGRGFKHAYIPAGGTRMPASAETRREQTDLSGNVRALEDFHMEGPELWGVVTSVVPGHINAFLAELSLTIEEIDLVVFHQASKMIIDTLAKALEIPPEKVFVHMEEIGNLSSASIPFALRAALEDGAIQRGDRVLISAFGVGISYGSAILEF